METHIPFDTWWNGDERALATALEILQDERDRADRENGKGNTDSRGRVTSG